MKLLADVFVALVALLHVYFLVLEMFLWDNPLGLKTFRHSAAEARRRRSSPPTRASTTVSSPPASPGASRSARPERASRSSSSPA